MIRVTYKDPASGAVRDWDLKDSPPPMEATVLGVWHRKTDLSFAQLWSAHMHQLPVDACVVRPGETCPHGLTVQEIAPLKSCDTCANSLWWTCKIALDKSTSPDVWALVTNYRGGERTTDCKHYAPKA